MIILKINNDHKHEHSTNSLDIIGMELVDRVVGEVDARVPEIAAVLVLDGGQAHKSLLIKVHHQGIQRRHPHIQTQVTLVPVHQQR